MNIPSDKPASRLGEQRVLLLSDQAIENFDLEDFMARGGASDILQLKDPSRIDEVISQNKGDAMLAFVGLSRRSAQEEIVAKLLSQDVKVVVIGDAETTGPADCVARLVRPFSDGDVEHALRSLDVIA